MQPLYNKYRPQTLDEVVGQEELKQTLKTMLSSHTLPNVSFLFGPSGNGKTTLARIICNYMLLEESKGEEVVSSDIILEINCGDKKDAIISDIEQFTSSASFLSRYKMIILDECHLLTTAAQSYLLKILEDAKPGTYFFLCSTHQNKMLETIQSRGTVFTVEKLTNGLLLKFLFSIFSREKLFSSVEGLTFTEESTLYEEIKTSLKNKEEPTTPVSFLATVMKNLVAGCQGNVRMLLSNMMNVIPLLPFQAQALKVSKSYLSSDSKDYPRISKSLESFNEFKKFIQSVEDKTALVQVMKDYCGYEFIRCGMDKYWDSYEVLLRPAYSDNEKSMVLLRCQQIIQGR